MNIGDNLGKKKYNKSFPSDPDLLPEIEDWIMEIAQEAKLNEDKYNHLALSVAEASANSIVHGNKSDKNITVDVRIIAATNKDLWEEMENHKFRADLYYRLNVVSIHLPPLRERQEDIPLIAEYFRRKFTADVKKEVGPFSKDALNVLIQHSWPGNIRQLRNIVERAVLIATEGKPIGSGALSMSGEGLRIDRHTCDGCGRCVEECPSTALELLGEAWDLEDLVKEVIKDRVYFEKSSGGVTVSGGEPTIQADFAAEFLKRIRGAGIKTALDTCGLCSARSLDKLLPHANLVLFDLKEIDPRKHRDFTGSDNRVILENLVHVAAYIDSHLYPEGLWIRTPLIPGATDTVENLAGIGAWIKTHLDQKVKRWELCAFNNLCRDKYTRLGLTWQFAGAELLEKSHVQHLVSAAQNSGVNPDIVHWSGSVKFDPAETDPAVETSGLRVVP